MWFNWMNQSFWNFIHTRLSFHLMEKCNLYSSGKISPAAHCEHWQNSFFHHNRFFLAGFIIKEYVFRVYETYVRRKAPVIRHADNIRHRFQNYSPEQFSLDKSNQNLQMLMVVLIQLFYMFIAEPIGYCRLRNQ